MKRFINDFLRFGFVGICIGLGFFITAFVFIKAASLTATSGTPLTAGNWNEMISNFFWGSGSGGIYYNGKVGIGTSSPNKSLHIYNTTNNAELDIQSVVGINKHWGIYQDAVSEELRMRNNFDRVTITTGGNMSVGGLCLNGTCKSSWDQVGSSVTLNYTGTCDFSHKGYTGIFSNLYKICDGSVWVLIKTMTDGTESKPGTSCYQILGDYPSSTNGIYWIDPNGGSISDEFQVYCDMGNGGWTLVSRMIYGANYLVTTALGSISSYTQGTAWKLSDANINAIPKNTGYKLACGSETRSAIFPTTCIFQGSAPASGACDPYSSGTHYVMQNHPSGSPYMVIYGYPGQGCRAHNTGWYQSGRLWVK